jgi:acyl carrier protein
MRVVTESEAAKMLAVVAETLDADISDIDLDTELLQTGRLDSLAMLALVAFLEDELGVKLAIDQIVPENFSSVRQMTKLVEHGRR